VFAEANAGLIRIDSSRSGTAEKTAITKKRLTYATGGEASAKNIEMRCRGHNGFEWERHLDSETLAFLPH
jgi:hypothetical protein